MDVSHLEKAIVDEPNSFRELFDATPDGILLVDSAGTIVFANQAMGEMCGVAPDQLAGASVESLVPDEQRELHAKQRAAFHERPKRRPLGLGLALRLKRAGGGELLEVDIELCPVLIDGEQLVLASVRRMPEPGRRERRSAHGEGSFLSMFERSSLALVIADARHRISGVNAAMERFLGYREQDLLGTDFRSLVLPEDLADVSSRMTRLVDGRISTFQAEVRFLGSDGTERTGNLTASAIVDEMMPATGTVHIIEDITTRRKLERRLEALAAEARETLRLLTQRETEVLELCADGLSARQIAAKLFLSARTVESHLASAYKKLAVNGKTEATGRFLQLRHAAATDPNAPPPAGVVGRATT